MSLTHYLPSWIEVSIMAGTFAGFILTYMVATKFFPIISMWEIQEGREQSVQEVSERVAEYLPDKVEAATP
jgi:molybdopterin-containing oxidoreductase family membrane subunit